MKKSGERNVGEQSKAFIEAAKALECDESEERFDAALKKVAWHKPPADATGSTPAEQEKPEGE